MRATCESCDEVQPPDWQPGDLCIECGAVVHRQQCCHWCVKLTPLGKYCRYCGAGQVPEEQYPAARWMKFVGSDQFVIPGRLAGMDPDQITHLTRLYQQDNVVTQHVQRMQLAESYLRHQGGWAQAWEDTMLPLLPLPEAQLEAWRTEPLESTTVAEQLAEIRDTSPLPIARSLASLARLRLLLATDATFEESGLEPDVANARLHLDDADLILQAEAGLLLSHWRLLMEQISNSHEYRLAQAVSAAVLTGYATESFTNNALIDACNKPGPQHVSPQDFGHPDPDVVFTAALASQNSAVLFAALRVPRRCFAAALTLSKMQADFDLASLLPGFTARQTGQLLWVISGQKRPRPDLRPLLLRLLTGQLAISSKDQEPFEDLLMLDLRPGDAGRLITARASTRLIRKVLEAPTLPLGEVADVCHELVRFDLFELDRLPVLRTLIAQAALPLSFVPAVIGEAPDLSFRNLQEVVQQQLRAYPVAEVQPLHRLVRRLYADTSQPALVRRWSNQLLMDWYVGDNKVGRPALTFTEQAAGTYFATFQEFIEAQVHLLENEDDFKELDFSHRLHSALEQVRSVEAPALLNAALTTLPPALLRRLCTALVAFIEEQGEWNPRAGAFHILNAMRFHQPWHAEAQATLEAMRDGWYSDEVKRLLATGPAPA